MQLKLAIEYLQEHKIIHRDLSLDNILIDQDLNVKVSDFGISSQMNNKTHLYTDGSGKRPYKAP